MRASILIPVIPLLALSAGCGGNAEKPAPATTGPAPEPAPAGPSGPMFDDLDYANWKRFPVGTTVKRKSVTSSEGSAVTVTTVETFTLKGLNDQHAEVSWQNTTERSDGSNRAENPPSVRKIARQFPIPNGMTADDFNKPSRKARPAGEETVTVLGKPYKAVVYAWTDSTEAGPLDVKVWLCDEIPGRIVRQEMRQAGLKNTTVDEVTELTVPG